MKRNDLQIVLGIPPLKYHYLLLYIQIFVVRSSDNEPGIIKTKEMFLHPYLEDVRLSLHLAPSVKSYLYILYFLEALTPGDIVPGRYPRGEGVAVITDVSALWVNRQIEQNKTRDSGV